MKQEQKDLFFMGCDIGMGAAAELVRRYAGGEKFAQIIEADRKRRFEHLNLWKDAPAKPSIDEMKEADLGIGVMQPGDLGMEYYA